MCRNVWGREMAGNASVHSEGELSQNDLWISQDGEILRPGGTMAQESKQREPQCHQTKAVPEMKQDTFPGHPGQDL